MFALIVSDCDFDLPQYLLIAFAYRRAESPDGGWCVEIKDIQEVFVIEPFVGLQTASAHQGIRDTGCRRVSKPYSDVVFIITFEK